MSLSSRDTGCPGFEGNSDFYGLGIRIGIYLQWSSAWISNSINPSGAAANHDANTVFLIALLVAFAVALGNGSLRLVEAYVMLLLSSGFFFTSVSFLGLRIYLWQPSTISAMREGTLAMLRTFFEKIEKLVLQAKQQSATETTQMSSLTRTSSLPMAILNMWIAPTRYPKQKIGGIERVKMLSLGAASKIKHPAFSWGGVAARAAVGTLAFSLSIWLWFGSSTRLTPGGRCDAEAYFFGVREISGSLLIFFRVASIMLAVPIIWLLLCLINIVVQLISLSRDWLVRDRVIKWMERHRKGRWDQLTAGEKHLLGVMVGSTNQITNPSVLRTYLRGLRAIVQRIQLPSLSVLDEFLGRIDEFVPDQAAGDDFWTISANELPPLSQIVHANISFWSRGIDMQAKEKECKSSANLS